MSHTATIKAIKIQSISALRAAVSEMASKGIKCRLVENASPRAYYQGQQGLGVAPFVLVLDDAKFDVGFYLDKDGTYEARTDFWNNSVEKVLGAPACSATSKEQARLGKLFQTYSIHTTLEEAKKKGWTAMRKTKPDGSEHVILTGM